MTEKEGTKTGEERLENITAVTKLLNCAGASSCNKCGERGATESVGVSRCQWSTCCSLSCLWALCD